MKKVCVTLLLSMPLMAAASNCDEISASIAEKIRNNGVPAANFELKLIPTEKQAQQTEGKIVGTCNVGQHKIVYLRTDSIGSSSTERERNINSESVNTESVNTETNREAITKDEAQTDSKVSESTNDQDNLENTN
ncbi:DUF1161 domain-containing protein [Orbaceae bacterium ESL0721]|nr:DUF1161 domain-containing protein [Orbaceae bacterium ESL0721]